MDTFTHILYKDNTCQPNCRQENLSIGVWKCLCCMPYTTSLAVDLKLLALLL